MFHLDGLPEISRPNVLIHGGGNAVRKPLRGGVRPGSLISSFLGQNLPQPVFSMVSILFQFFFALC